MNCLHTCICRVNVRDTSPAYPVGAQVVTNRKGNGRDPRSTLALVCSQLFEMIPRSKTSPGVPHSPIIFYYQKNMKIFKSIRTKNISSSPLFSNNLLLLTKNIFQQFSNTAPFPNDYQNILIFHSISPQSNRVFMLSQYVVVLEQEY